MASRRNFCFDHHGWALKGYFDATRTTNVVKKLRICRQFDSNAPVLSYAAHTEAWIRNLMPTAPDRDPSVSNAHELVQL